MSESKNDDPGGCPDTVIGDCEPVCARCGRDLAGEAHRQTETRDGKTWTRILYTAATDWVEVVR